MKRILLALLFVSILCSIALAQEDTTPPELIDLFLTPPTIDTSTGEQVVRLVFSARDSLSGVRLSQSVVFKGPSGQDPRNFGSAITVSGTRQDGTFEIEMPIRQFSEPGTWQLLSFGLIDAVGNRQDFTRDDLLALGFTMLDIENVAPPTSYDTTPPELIDLFLTPPTIDTSTGEQVVRLVFSARDSLSGVRLSQSVVFKGPSGQDPRNFGSAITVSGTRQDGTFEIEMPIRQFSEPGTWQLLSFGLIDAVGNRQDFTRDDLLALGFTMLDIENVEDTTPPQLEYFNFTPTSINVSTGPQGITCTLEMTEDISGFSSGYARIMSPSGQQRVDCDMNPPPISGDLYDGTFQGTASFPQFSETGTWHVENLQLTDLISNDRNYSEAELDAMGFPTELEVMSTVSDTTPPQLEYFNFTPTSINVSTGPQGITCTLEMTEDISGFSSGYARIMSPSGQQRVDCDMNPPPISGDLYDGTFQGTASFPQSSETGTWHVENLQLTDLISNDRNYSEAELDAMGFPTELVVSSTAADTDGDGIPDDVDECPDTVIPESVPTKRLGTNRFALVDEDGIFDTKSPKGNGPHESFTIEDTAGCNCEQIIEEMGLGKGHEKFGCSLGVMREWVDSVNQ